MADNNNIVDDQEDEVDETPDEELEASEAALNSEGKPVTKADWDALQEALKKARRDARTAKRKPSDEKDGQDKSAEELEREIRTKVQSEYKPVVVRARAEAAFAKAGLKDDKFNRAFRLLDLDDLELTEDGQIDGLDDQIADLKEDVPELFVQRRASRIDGADRSGDRNGKSKSAMELHAEKLMGLR